jgi:predicted MFS family arabinose efflux permease
MNQNKFSPYQRNVVVLLAIVQFTIVLDFMVMAPLGDILMKSMQLDTKQFAAAVSAYAFSAGASGLLAAGFADKYDRKKILLFFYSGFIVGTFICGIATTYPVLMAGRIICGLFGGVMGSISMAIVADLFAYELRGRVMGIVQMAFAVSQVAGIPFGLYLANNFGWEAPFLLIVAISIISAFAIWRILQPVSKHIGSNGVNPILHLKNTVSNRKYMLPFATTALLSIGGYLMMPFSTPFIINNVEILQEQLPVIYVVTGIGSMIMMPLIGRISDRVGKYPTFLTGSIIAMIMIWVYTHLNPVPVWQVIVVNTIMFAGIMSRMIPSTALMSAIPTLEDRGAFMSINSSLQQVAGGVASVLAGLIIYQKADGKLVHFDTLGYVAIFIMVICAFQMFVISKTVTRKLQQQSHSSGTKVESILEKDEQ